MEAQGQAMLNEIIDAYHDATASVRVSLEATPNLRNLAIVALNLHDRTLRATDNQKRDYSGYDSII